MSGIFLASVKMQRENSGVSKRNDGLVSQLSLQELTGQAGDVSDRLFLGQAASEARVFGTVTQSELIHACNHLGARAAASTRPCGRSASWLTFELTKSIAEPFLHAATQAPQPIHVAQSIASSAFSLGIRIALAS